MSSLSVDAATPHPVREIRRYAVALLVSFSSAAARRRERRRDADGLVVPGA